MSQSDRPALGSRENFWGESEDADDQEDRSDNRGHGAPEYNYTREKARYVADQLLVPFITKVDPEAIFEDPDEFEYALHDEQGAQELSDPTLYLAQQATKAGGQSTGQESNRTRVNEETGLATGPYYESLPFEEFMEALNDILPYWQSQFRLSDDRVGDLRHDARCMKSAGDYKDLEILSRLLEELILESGPQGPTSREAREAARTGHE